MNRQLEYTINANKCHIYAGRARDRNGYSVVKVDGQMWYGHRYVYTQMHGPIPGGLEVMHSKGCDRACINIDHLSTGTHQQNMADIKEHKKRYCAGGHELTRDSSYTYHNRTICRICRAQIAARTRAGQANSNMDIDTK